MKKKTSLEHVPPMVYVTYGDEAQESIDWAMENIGLLPGMLVTLRRPIPDGELADTQESVFGYYTDVAKDVVRKEGERATHKVFHGIYQNGGKLATWYPVVRKESAPMLCLKEGEEKELEIDWWSRQTWAVVTRNLMDERFLSVCFQQTRVTEVLVAGTQPFTESPTNTVTITAALLNGDDIFSIKGVGPNYLLAIRDTYTKLNNENQR